MVGEVKLPDASDNSTLKKFAMANVPVTTTGTVKDSCRHNIVSVNPDPIATVCARKLPATSNKHS